MNDRQEEEFEEDIEPIAIVGMAGRFPGADSVAELWRNLAAGVESISHFSREELAEAGVPAELLDDPDYVRSRGALRDVEHFDADFFGFAPREAQLLDPQHRIFLELCWEAIEIAGHDASRFDGRIGVFAGARRSDYFLNNLVPSEGYSGSFGDLGLDISNGQDFLASRVAYKLGLEGPALVVQTACSTSLVAVHLACQSLLIHECEMALAGGVAIQLPQLAGYQYFEGGINSPDGHCRAFDADAEGTVNSSGAGVVVLRRLRDALAGGEPVLAVIRGSAINNDGSRKVGFAAPSPEGQARAISEALQIAAVNPESIGYLEAHGTGTALGDPVEISALKQAFDTQERGYCALGSLKSNLGHLDNAAGVAGLIKTVLALQHKQIPPSLHFKRADPELGLEQSPFFVNTLLRDWPPGEVPRRAGVSSFGVGGTNVHVVLEEAATGDPASETSSGSNSSSSSNWQLLVLSAHSEWSLEEARRQLAEHLADCEDHALADVAHTLQQGRKCFAHRFAAPVRDVEEAIRLLSRPVASASGGSPAVEESKRPVAFLFPGQGAQHIAMGRGLYHSEPVFRTHFDRGSQLLEQDLGLDLADLLYASGGDAEAASALLGETRLAQPAIFLLEFALAQLWISWGVTPVAMLGHSVGEIVAACLAGVFRFEDALRLVADRGRMMQAQPRGGMLAVPLCESDVQTQLEGGLALAAVNALEQTVVSGPFADLHDFEARMTLRGVECRRLHTSHAFHSGMMDAVEEALRERFARVDMSSPTIPFLSNVTGSWATSADVCTPDYWARQMRQTVRFADSLQILREDPSLVLLEVGPGQSLRALASASDATLEPVISSMRHAKGGQLDEAVVLGALGEMWSSGVEVSWEGVRSSEGRRRVPLPSYAFDRKRHWVDAPLAGSAAGSPLGAEKTLIDDWLYVPGWRRSAPLEWTSSSPESEFKADLGLDLGSGSPKTWLIFLDSTGLASSIALRLRALGCRAITVQLADGYQRVAEDEFLIAAGSREDSVQLFSELASGQEFPDGIVHALTLSDDSRLTDAEIADRGFNSLLFLAESLGLREGEASVRLEILSSGLFDVLGEESLACAKATLLGPARVMPHEIPGIHCRVFDLEPLPADQAHAKELVETLVREIFSPPHNATVAYRRGIRWLPHYEALPLKAHEGGHPRITAGASYLITGGTLDPGLAFAERLVECGARGIVFLGAEGKTPQGPGEAERIARIDAMRAQGARVLSISCDITQASLVAEALDKAELEIGPVRGVIHAAEAQGGGLLQLKSCDAAAGVLAPKVAGTRALYGVVEARELDFMLLMGSSIALTGAMGMGDVAAANAFLAAFAESHARTSRFPIFHIAWSIFKDASPGDGDTNQAEAMKSLIEATLQDYGITSIEGATIMDRAMAAGARQLVVSRYEFNALAKSQSQLTASDFTKQLDLHRAALQQRTGAQDDASYAAPESEVQRVVASEWQSVLGIEPIGIHDNFFDLGGNSLLAIQMAGRLKREFEVDDLVSHFFESPTVAGLALAIEEQSLTADELAEMAEIMREIEELSEEEVAAQLAAHASPGGEES